MHVPLHGRRLLLPLIAFFTLAAPAALAKDAKPDGMDLVRRGLELTDLREGGPYHMHAQLQMHDFLERKDITGVDDVYWQSAKQWRRELRMAGYYSESALFLDGQLYRLRAPNFTPPAARRDVAASLRLLPDALHLKAGRVSSRTIGRSAAECVYLSGSGEESNWCFDATSGLPLAHFLKSYDDRIEFAGYKPLGTRFVPGTIQHFWKGKSFATAAIETVELNLPKDAKLFQPFPKAEVRPWCDDTDGLKAITTTRPDLPQWARSSTGLQLTYEVTIDAKGDVANVVPMAENPPLDVIVMQTLAHWKFHPAMCGSTPVPTDIVRSFRPE